MIPQIADSDDTSQIPWPAARSRQQPQAERSRTPSPRRLLSTWDLVTLSVSMAGAQIAWTVELGYGTPFLLNLGLEEHLTSLCGWQVRLYRRRFWIGVSTIALVLSTLVLAYCVELANFVVDLLAVGAGDWTERRKYIAKNTAIGLAIVSFYVLDFALNGLQSFSPKSTARCDPS
ncbi:hypothetical protein CPB84DRAFT_46546 [Gymnopilus junonius]|uniref:Uncharacterized protein n=1 Tax=Gymnopilus junonius TaxID=109634 RepID=A0A9P5TTW4_GYMJU|nr:hypothetical protein CPB84DRAFT_46546 [Gymnopilus junonius]